MATGSKHVVVIGTSARGIEGRAAWPPSALPHDFPAAISLVARTRAALRRQAVLARQPLSDVRE